MTLDLRTDRTLIRANGGSDRYLVAHFNAPGSDRPHARPPVNVALVIDRSGSMEGQKIDLAKKAVQMAVALLRPTDRFAIVAYDDRIEVVVGSTAATAEAKRQAGRALEKIDARGSTNLGEGWLRGCEQVAAQQDERYISRVLLLTDGLANQGIVEPEELRHHARALRSRGVRTTTIGLGEDFNEELLRSMSLAGGGNFYFVESAGQIADTMMSELQEALDIVARSVALVLRAPEGVLIEHLTEALVEREGASTRIVVGDAVSDQEFEIVVRVNFPSGEVERYAQVQVALDDRDGAMRAMSEMTWQYADHHRSDVQQRDRTVDRIVARLYAARAKREAVGLNRHGDFAAASSALRGVGDRIRGYAGDDAELQAIMSALEAESGLFAARMDEFSRKQAYFASSNVSRMRTADGKARKGHR
ncbi:MAG: VWA domain-containing protein [Chloroflexota bacterium]|nr:VWA domain-containing protein [Chloroflexota bacterium]